MSLVFFSLVILGFSSPNLVFADDPPVIITQVELSTPLQVGYTTQTVCTVMLNDTKVCYPVKNPYDNPRSPYYNIDCRSFNGENSCELIHEDVINNHVCDSLHAPAGQQKIDIYNNLNHSVNLTNFEVNSFVNKTVYVDESLQYTKEFSEGNWNVTMNPHQICTFAISSVNTALEIPLRNTSFTITYVYDGKNYTVNTPFLTDLNNDSKTWQDEGNKWVFAEQNTVTVPEFPFVIPILLIGIISLIVFYKIKFVFRPLDCS